ncbi:MULTISPECIES: hypothetical protein [unclassified Massilia]|uniref:hypothetical protein n=1 Tax=unclassified Massilia TaxID=2609279 RepID=UPI001786BF91|nr:MULTISPECIES: hypothetical protein [unclassified Massilia]MBD8532712.1 hypothetical protein [Massilia sp. CFBP 13647]MBD8676073.1 hypothetical protein [Massilia sp. CFBP 13721]
MKKKPKGQQADPSPSDMVVGIGWYIEPEWARMKATAIDFDVFEDSFSEWESMASDNLKLVRKANPNTVKVFIRADEFFTWCHLRALTNIAETRAEFVAEKLRATTPSLPSISLGSER